MKFADLVVANEMIKCDMKSGRIEAEETRGGTMLKDEKETQVFLSRESTK